MDLHYLEYIIEIANMHSISRAADNLFVTPSSLSQYLSRLEQELGVKLFERKRNEMQLTAAGKLYVESCEQMLLQRKELYNQISELAAGKTGAFSVGITPQWGSLAYAHVIGKFQERYPNVSVSVSEEIAAPLIHRIQEGSLDMAIIPLADGSELPENAELMQAEELVLAIPTSHAAQMNFTDAPNGEGLFIAPSELKDEPMIFSQPKTTIRQVQQDWFGKRKVNPHIICEINSHPASLLMTAQGLGSTFVPASYMQPMEGVVYAHAAPIAQWLVVLAFRKDFVLHSSERYFIELIREYFRGVS